jgi:hypothetical protein
MLHQDIFEKYPIGVQCFLPTETSGKIAIDGSVAQTVVEARQRLTNTPDVV